MSRFNDPKSTNTDLISGEWKTSAKGNANPYVTIRHASLPYGAVCIRAEALEIALENAKLSEAVLDELVGGGKKRKSVRQK